MTRINSRVGGKSILMHKFSIVLDVFPFAILIWVLRNEYLRWDTRPFSHPLVIFPSPADIKSVLEWSFIVMSVPQVVREIGNQHNEEQAHKQPIQVMCSLLIGQESGH